jgi:threonine dehydrogenase-like Zn-dependent dehydrogenase
MRCVVLTGPREISVQDRPEPKIVNDGDVIVRVHLSGLCGEQALFDVRDGLTKLGSELHTYRGHAGPQTAPIVMGHELTGEIVDTGKGVKLWKEGDKVISPFSLSCGMCFLPNDRLYPGSCFYCDRNHTSRCDTSTLLGTPSHDGAQAEYVRISMADASLFRQPEDIPPQLSLLLADVIPTGYSMAYLAHQILNMDKPEKEVTGVCVVIGCGPVSSPIQSS